METMNVIIRIISPLFNLYGIIAINYWYEIGLITSQASRVRLGLDLKKVPFGLGS